MPHRHFKTARKFGRRKEARQALMKGLTGQVILYERVRTTEARAKEVKPLVEKAISVAKAKEEVAAIREIKRMVTNPKAAEKAVKELKEAYQGRTGGYARVIRLTPRAGDGSPMALVELSEFDVKKAPEGDMVKEKVKSGKVKVTRKRAGESPTAVKPAEKKEEKPAENPVEKPEAEAVK